MFLDVETTGVEEHDRLIQVAYKYLNGEAFVEYFKPPIPISVDAMSICHITNNMVADKQPFVESEMHDFLQAELGDGPTILVAHNANFDIGFLEKEGVNVPSYICTMKVTHHWDKKAVLEKHTLQYMRYYFGLEFDKEINPHDALSDVFVLEELFKYYLKEGYTIEQMMKISQEPIIMKRVPFGKYKGLLWKDVPRDYLIWMRKQVDLEPNLKATLDHYINIE